MGLKKTHADVTSELSDGLAGANVGELDCLVGTTRAQP